ncbi:MAG: PAS domain-containing protein [bacterium]
MKKRDRLLVDKVLVTDSDITKYNTDGVLLHSIGRDTLLEIVYDSLYLFDTCAAIYEKNGEYALAVFNSDWCRFLNEASRKLCKTDDSMEAMKCGKWLCHESCWTNASQIAIETGKPFEGVCSGGIHIYAVPVKSENKIVGAINVGYGTPPKDVRELSEIASRYNVSVDKLIKLSQSYELHLPLITDIAKRNLRTSARLIGEISEHTEDKFALMRSEAHCDLAQRSANIASWDWNILTGELHWSNKIESLFGFAPGKFRKTYEAFIECVHPEDRKYVVDLLNACIQGDKKYDIEHRIVWPNGSVRWVSENGNVIRGKDNRVIRMLGIVQDITERRERRNATIVLKDYTENIIKSMKDMLIVITPEGTIQTVNKATEDILGYREDELIGKQVDKMLNIDIEMFFHGKGLEELLKKRYIADHYMTCKTKTGEFIPVNFCGSIMADDDGNTVGLVGVIRDMREVEGLMNDLNNMKETHKKLVQVERMATVGALTADISHTIGNMMTNLIASSSGNIEEIDKLKYIRKLDTLFEKKYSPDEIYERYKTISKEFSAIRSKYTEQLNKIFEDKTFDMKQKYTEQREKILSSTYSRVYSYSEGLLTQTNLMNNSIKSLLSLARLEGNKKEKIDINKILLTAYSILSNYETHGIKFEKHLTANLPYVEVDFHQILNCFVNIMLNGIEAMANEGVLTYGTELCNDNEIKAYISDTGPGIPKEILGNLFKPFFTTKEKGTGLGLSMVQSIIETHNGKIEVSSSKKGAIFTVTLPIEEES